MGELMEKGDENAGISILSSSASTLHYGLLGFWILYIIIIPNRTLLRNWIPLYTQAKVLKE